MTAMTRSGLRELVLLPPTVVQLSAWPELEEAVGVASTALTPGARRWLTVAAAHRSALYERSGDFPGVSPTCLTLLGSVGKAAVDVELRRSVAKAAPSFTAAGRDQEANRVGTQLRRSLVRTLAVPRNALLGRGEAEDLARKEATGLPGRTLEAVAYQVIGWWSLVLDGHRLRQFVDDLYVLAASTASAKAAEARTIFDRCVDNAEFEVTRAGPDHAAVFRVTVRTPDGRAGTGEGLSKKAAEHGASFDYLSRHLPHALAGKGPTPGRGPSGRRRTVSAVDQRLVELAAMFGCRKWEPFGRALTHRSWVYENTVNRDTERESNALLANLGSSVLSATTMRRRAANLLGQTSDPDPEVAVPVSVPDAALRRVFDALGLQRLVRVGRGYHGQTLPDSMTSDIVQAMLAASHVQWPSQASFEDHLPDVVRGFLDDVTAVSLIDPFTRLQELASELSFSIIVGEADRTGPDHQTVYTIALRIEGLSLPISAEASAGSKTSANKIAAAKILDSAALLSDDVQEHSDLALARALLVRQLAVLPNRKSRWPLWHRSGRLGVKLLLSGDPSEFDKWSRATVRVLGGEWRPDADTERALAQYYSEAQRPVGGRRKFNALLEEVADRIVDLASGSDVSDALPLDDLVALSAAQSVWMSSGEDVTLSGVLEDWSAINQRRCEISVDAESPQVPISACAGAAILKCLHECVTAARSGGDQTLVVRGRRSGRRYDILVQCGDRLWGLVAASPRLQLITESAADLRLASDGDSIRLSVEISPHATGDNWLAAATRAAREVDEYDAELARLVHDLKNEVTAAHVAARRPAATRTDRLEAQLAASRHLDTAGGIAARLRAADRLYSAADLVGETELAAFMQAYVSDLIRGIDGGIRVIPPAFLPVTVAMDEGALRAVLDNLVANAAAAMSAGGQISLEYVTSAADGMVLLELTDTGAGLPEDVARALAAGRPSPSEKKQGSGLGLLGVRRVLGRVGGRLESLDRSKGTGWLITLPIIDAPAAAESRHREELR